MIIENFGDLIIGPIGHPWVTWGPGVPPGVWEPQATPEAVDKSTGVVFHAELEFQVQNGPNIVKNQIFVKKSFFLKKFDFL